MCMHEISYYILRIVCYLHTASAVGQPRAAKLVRDEIPVPTPHPCKDDYILRSSGPLFKKLQLWGIVWNQAGCPRKAACNAGQHQNEILFASQNWQYSCFCSILIIL